MTKNTQMNGYGNLSINLYDSVGTYELDTGRRNKRTTYFLGNEYKNGHRLTRNEYDKIKDYNNYRDIANKGMSMQTSNNVDIANKKRKNLFTQDNTTLFGN